MGGRIVPNSLGVDIQGFVERYAVSFEDSTKTWRILDLKHPETLKLASLDDDISDKHLGLTIIPELMFSKLIAEAIRLGALSPSVVGIGNMEDKNTEINEESDLLKKSILTLERLNQEQISIINKLRRELDSKPNGSEEFLLKAKIIDTLRQMAIGENPSGIK